MDLSDENFSASGYLTDGFEGISRTFTDMEVLWQTRHNRLARAKRYGRWWILKSLKPEYAGQTFYQQMMRKELEMLMRLQHPYVVQAVGMEEVEGWGVCVVMEYVDGVRLDVWLAERRGKEDRLRLVEELLDAVDYIHSKGVVHRDLKPDNILVTRNGADIRLIDFGLADNDHQAILKQPAGTPPYMSPEQMENAVPDVRNDVYSLGLVLKLLLPEWEFGTIVKRCLLPVDKRFQNVTSLVRALKRRKGRTHRWVLVGWMALVLCLSVGLGIQTWRIHSYDHRRKKMEMIIKEGIAKVEHTLCMTGIDRHLDTLSHPMYLSETFGERHMDGYDAANRYLDSIRPLFTQMEMAEIVNAVMLYCGERQTEWINRIETLNQKREDDEDRAL